MAGPDLRTSQVCILLNPQNLIVRLTQLLTPAIRRLRCRELISPAKTDGVGLESDGNFSLQVSKLQVSWLRTSDTVYKWGNCGLERMDTWPEATEARTPPSQFPHDIVSSVK